MEDVATSPGTPGAPTREEAGRTFPSGLRRALPTPPSQTCGLQKRDDACWLDPGQRCCVPVRGTGTPSPRHGVRSMPSVQKALEHGQGWLRALLGADGRTLGPHPASSV